MRWEYKVVHVVTTKWSATGLPHDVGERMDLWGSEGWELVRVEPILGSGLLLGGFGTTSRTIALIMFFKRPLPDSPSNPASLSLNS